MVQKLNSKKFRQMTLVVAVAMSSFGTSYGAKFNVRVTSMATHLVDPSLKTIQGRGIPLVRIDPTNSNDPKNNARFYLQAALHGNEALTTQFLFWLIRRIERGDSPLAKINQGNVGFDLVPAANPDGLKLRSRANAGQVNLNRNFSVGFGETREYPGKNSFSEPETRAVRTLFSKEHYTAAVDVHGFVNWLVIPSAPTSTATAEQVDIYRRWHEIILSSRASLQTIYQVQNPRTLGDGGAFEDWSFWDANVPALCLELASAFRFDVVYGPGSAVQRVDFFERYEKFLAEAFQGALTLKNRTLTN